MTISDIKQLSNGSGVDRFTAQLKEIKGNKTFDKGGETKTLQKIVLADGGGQMKAVLWGRAFGAENIGQVFTFDNNSDQYQNLKLKKDKYGPELSISEKASIEVGDLPSTPETTTGAASAAPAVAGATQPVQTPTAAPQAAAQPAPVPQSQPAQQPAPQDCMSEVRVKAAQAANGVVIALEAANYAKSAYEDRRRAAEPRTEFTVVSDETFNSAFNRIFTHLVQEGLIEKLPHTDMRG